MELELINTKIVKKLNNNIFEGTFKISVLKQKYYLYATLPMIALEKNYSNKEEDGLDVHIYAHPIEEIEDSRIFEITTNFDKNILKKIRNILLDEFKNENRTKLIDDRYKLIVSYFCNNKDGTAEIFEGMFEDLSEFDCQIFACIFNFDNPVISIYAQSYETTSKIKNYDITSNFDKKTLEEFKCILLEQLYKKIKWLQ